MPNRTIRPTTIAALVLAVALALNPASAPVMAAAAASSTTTNPHTLTLLERLWQFASNPETWILILVCWLLSGFDHATRYYRADMMQAWRYSYVWMPFWAYMVLYGIAGPFARLRTLRSFTLISVDEVESYIVDSNTDTNQVG